MSPPGHSFAGRYRAEEQLGKGGFGLVFRALDTSTGRRVAVKQLREARLDGEARNRFDREARVVQRLAHPNTVRLFDFGSDADGTPFIVYELLEGETLSQIIRRGPIPLERTLRIASQVLAALSEAHGLGIVHRDIKPANIMVLEAPAERDVVKVLDFGIAKPTLAATKVLTATGAVIGTPRFMSPEQVNGSSVLPSSDVYAMGLLISEMLSGSRVFDGPPFDVMMAQLSEERVRLPPLVAASPVRAVIARAVEKDPAKRFANAGEMLSALSRVGAPDAQPMTAPPVSAPRQGLALPLALFAGLGALALVLAVGVAGAAWYLSSVPAPVRGTSTPTRGTSTPTPAPASTGGGMLVKPVDAKLPTLDVNALLEVMKKEGWSEISRDLEPMEGTLTFSKGERQAIVSYDVYSGPADAELRGTVATGTYAVARFGSTVVEFMIVHEKLDPKACTELRDKVVAALRARAP